MIGGRRANRVTLVVITGPDESDDRRITVMVPEIWAGSESGEPMPLLRRIEISEPEDLPEDCSFQEVDLGP